MSNVTRRMGIKPPVDPLVPRGNKGCLDPLGKPRGNKIPSGNYLQKPFGKLIRTWVYLFIQKAENVIQFNVHF